MIEFCKLIDETANRISMGEPKRISKRIILYSLGVKAKLEHTHYALLKIQELNSQTDALSTNQKSNFNASQKIEFYVDSFFAFLFSSFDVMAQVINQKMRLQVDEHKVSIKCIKKIVDANYYGTGLQISLDQMVNSNFFKNLERYRNCSTHRRQIYIRAEIVRIIQTEGYSVSGELDSVKRVLCDNPLSVNPSVSQERELISYCEIMLNKVCKKIEEIFNIL